jgi:hypothetical protein
VWGTKETTIASNTMREAFTYEFRIVPNHGEPKLTHFDAYPGRPKIRSKDPVHVTPYLTRSLALVKEFQPGEIILAAPEAQPSTNTAPTELQEGGQAQAATANQAETGD